MLKTLMSTKFLTRTGKDKVGLCSDSRAGHDGSEIDRSEVDDNEVGDNEVRKKVQKSIKFKNSFKSKKTVGSDFFPFGAKIAFTKLRQAFVKIPILHHFDLECHIWIEMDASDYAISVVLNQLTSDNLGLWYMVAFFSCKMIPVETRYKTHDSELLAIIEAFKT